MLSCHCNRERCLPLPMPYIHDRVERSAWLQKFAALAHREQSGGDQGVWAERASWDPSMAQLVGTVSCAFLSL